VTKAAVFPLGLLVAGLLVFRAFFPGVLLEAWVLVVIWKAIAK